MLESDHARRSVTSNAASYSWYAEYMVSEQAGDILPT